MSPEQMFEEWISGDRICGECGGVFTLFHWKWCNQVNIRCFRCNNMARPDVTGIPVDRALPHAFAREIYKRNIGFTAFCSRADCDEHYEIQRDQALNNLFETHLAE